MSALAAAYLVLVFFALSTLCRQVPDDDFYKKFFQNDYKVKFERAEFSFINKSYIELYHHSFKYNRSHAATNTSCYLHIDMGYDLEIVLQAFKFVSNEYRVFPMRFEFNFCKGFNNNFGGTKDCAKLCGFIECPLKKDVHYSACNCLFDETKMPPFIPNGQFLLQMDATYLGQIMATLKTYLTIFRPILPDKRHG